MWELPEDKIRKSGKSAILFLFWLYSHMVLEINDILNTASKESSRTTGNCSIAGAGQSCFNKQVGNPALETGSE